MLAQYRLHAKTPPSPSSRTTATKKLNPNRAGGNPSSSQPHWAKTELHPQPKPQLGCAQGQAGRGCGAPAPAGKASDLGNSHFPEINFFLHPCMNPIYQVWTAAVQTAAFNHSANLACLQKSKVLRAATEQLPSCSQSVLPQSWGAPGEGGQRPNPISAGATATHT